MRSATGGSLPVLTSSASCGASLNAFGAFPASVTTSGPSSLPTRELLLALWASAPAAMTPLRTPTARTAVSRDHGVVIDASPLTGSTLLAHQEVGGRLYGLALAKRRAPDSLVASETTVACPEVPASRREN